MLVVTKFLGERGYLILPLGVESTDNSGNLLAVTKKQEPRRILAIRATDTGRVSVTPLLGLSKDDPLRADLERSTKGSPALVQWMSICRLRDAAHWEEEYLSPAAQEELHLLQYPT